MKYIFSYGRYNMRFNLISIVQFQKVFVYYICVYCAEYTHLKGLLLPVRPKPNGAVQSISECVIQYVFNATGKSNQYLDVSFSIRTRRTYECVAAEVEWYMDGCEATKAASCRKCVSALSGRSSEPKSDRESLAVKGLGDWTLTYTHKHNMVY